MERSTGSFVNEILTDKQKYFKNKIPENKNQFK